MAATKCGACNAPANRFELDQVAIQRQVTAFEAHVFAFTVLKCGDCGAVLGMTEGSLAAIAKRQSGR
ncbi:MAG: hypothetical protein K8H88_06335 [Sandaracinaceae bacterium]|nr:hypothetical protein [Sandaracinaceae bacterium]